ncbi:MAG TPA: ATP-binding protein [Longimicrobiales bacterium]
MDNLVLDDRAVFPGNGEMAGLCRSFDWAATPLGPVTTWPQSLRTTVSTLLASRHPMFLWWGDDLVQVYNDAYRPSLGDRHPRALGMKGREFWTDIWPTIGPQIEQVMSGGDATWHEDQYLPIERNGRMEDVWWTYSYSAVRDDDGAVAGTLVVCQETTQRILSDRWAREIETKLAQQRENMLRAVFEQAPSFMCVMRGPELVYELANDAYYGLIGHREILRKPIREALPELATQGFIEVLEKVYATGQPFVGRELSVILQRTPGGDAEERFADFIFYPLVNDAGQREGIVVHGSDVTSQVMSRREAERLLEESERARADAEAARAEAQVANRAKVDFLRVMSHELRTPLNAIAGYSALLEMGIHGQLEEAQREDVLRIQASQRHLLRLINEVLNYAKLESGSLEYDIADVRAADAIAAAVEFVEPQYRTKKLELKIDDCADITARADEERTLQVLINLLTNALKFTNAGGRVDVRCTTAAEMVAIEVADTGIGIASEELERIFDPFVQSRSELTRSREGTGLGLAISRELARGMGGDVTVTSKPGVGSTFRLSLPAAGAAEAASGHQPDGGV